MCIHVDMRRWWKILICVDGVSEIVAGREIHHGCWANVS